MKTYITQRGKVTITRPYAQINAEERLDIIEDNLSHGSLYTMKKWNISMQTLGHIMYHQKKEVEMIEDKHMRENGL